MADEKYETPKITVLGEVTDITQLGKQGILFDFPQGSSELVDLHLNLNLDVAGLGVHIS